LSPRICSSGRRFSAGLQLLYVDAVQAPAVRGRIRSQLVLGLREGDIHARLALLESLEQKLQTEGRLAGARVPLNQLDAMGRQSASHQVIEARDAGRDPVDLHVCHLRFRCHSVLRYRAPLRCGGRARRRVPGGIAKEMPKILGNS